MKKHITILSLIAAAVIAVPALSCAADVSANSSGSSSQTVTSKSKVRNIVLSHGKVAAVDTNAMTLTVGNLVLPVTSDTKISRDGKPAKLSDGVVGERVKIAYKKSENGRLTANTILFGAKGEIKPKKAIAKD